MKKALKERRKLYKKILEKWENCEFLILAEKLNFKKRSSCIITGKSSTSIPFEVKIKLIREKIKRIVRDYIIKINNFKVVRNMYRTEIRNFRRQESVILEYNPIKPQSPNILDHFTSEEIKKLIHKSLRHRHSWKKNSCIEPTLILKIPDRLK